MNEKTQVALGQRIKEIRTELGLTLDQFSTAARRYGATWDPSAVKKLESGKTSASLPNMLVLVKVLESLTGKPMKLSDLFPGDGTIELNDEATITRAQLRRALDGGHYEILRIEPKPLPDEPVYEDIVDVIVGSTTKAVESIGLTAVNDAVAEYGDVMTGHVPTLAEKRAAKRLGITPDVVAALCLMEYGRFLDEEAAHQAGANATPQKRGRETRLIIEKLDLMLENAIEQVNIGGKAATTVVGRLYDNQPNVTQKTFGIAANMDANRDVESETPDD